MTFPPSARKGLAVLLGTALILPLLMAQGCPNPGTITAAGGLSVTVRAPSINQTVAVGDLITIVYDTVGSAATIKGFYDHDGVANTGDEVTFNSALAGGLNRYTQLATNSLSPGTYHLGISASNGSGTSTVYAAGAITLAGALVPIFTSPISNITIGSGVIVPVTFRVNGAASFSYQIFYDTDGTFDGDELTIRTGTSTTPNVDVDFDTSGLQPGKYFVGARITVPGSSSATAYAGGTVSIVTGSFVQVLAPVAGLVAIPGTQIQIIVAASDPGNSSATIRVFYDPDSTFTNGNDITITTLPVTGSGVIWDTSEVPGGSYFIGAELQNGLSPAEFSYSAGPVTLISSGLGDTGTGILTVTTPLIPTTLTQGKIFRINWQTSLHPGEGTVTVFREPDKDGDGVPDGESTRITIGNPGMDAAIKFVDFDTTGVLGTFFIGATLTPIIGDVVTDYAPGTLGVRPLIFWVGELATQRDVQTDLVIPQSGLFQGAILRGFNFQDNLGSAMMVADDYDRDGRNEIVLAAQFGKPFNFAQGGRGAGEAYMIYGRPQRYQGDFNVNNAGSTSLPGAIFSGILPNPFAGDATTLRARAGTSIPYTVDGQVAPVFATEGLRSITLIPDQEGDGKQELAFGIPWCNSYSLENQIADGFHPAPLLGEGRLENNGQFLRGGVVIVSSTTPVMSSRTALSRAFDRVIQLHEVGQVFGTPDMRIDGGVPTDLDNCGADGKADTAVFPCEGFWQNTRSSTGFVIEGSGLFGLIDPPRLADPILPIDDTEGLMQIDEPCQLFFNFVDLDQIDPPRTPPDPFSPAGKINFGFSDSACPSDTGAAPFGEYPFTGFMQTLGTGFYTVGTDCAGRTFLPSDSPFGCRILGQTTTQIGASPPTTANRFGSSISTTGQYLLVGAPLRTVRQADVPQLPTATREEAGEIYMLRLDNYWADHFLTRSVTINTNPPQILFIPPDVSTPAPFNYVIQDVGYTTLDSGCVQRIPTTQTSSGSTIRGGALIEMSRPLHIVGAAPGDRVGEVTGVGDINNDGFTDIAVGGSGTNGGKGAVYVIYRRPSEVEGDYLLEKLQVATSDPNRLNGLMIIGEIGENLGTAVAGGGPLSDDYNGDGHADLLIGSPNSTPAAGFHAGQVFLLFGGKNLLNPFGGSTIAQLRAAGDGMLISGANAGDAAGTTVANAGDVNGDGTSDILIAAPNASPRFDSDGNGTVDSIGLDFNGDGVADDLDKDGVSDDLTGAGIVYVVFGGQHLTGTIGLDQIGTAFLPGFTIVGHKAGDHLGGGVTQTDLLARGVSPAGDLDGDGRADLLVGSILASPEGKTHAGEVYLVYGFRP